MPRPHMPEHNWKNSRKVIAHTLLIYAGFPNRKTQVQSINRDQRQNSQSQANTLGHIQMLFIGISSAGLSVIQKNVNSYIREGKKNKKYMHLRW